MAIQKTEAIILKKFDFRDTSLIVTLFTRDFGKIKAVVKGIRKEGNADLVHFEILNHLSIVFYEKAKSELHLLSESFLEDPMLGVRNSFRTFVFGSYLAELVDALYEIHEISPGVFDRLLLSLKKMEQETVPFWVLVFELSILKEAGLFPGMKSCVRCAKTREEHFVWSPRQGGLLCGNCSIKEARTFPVTREMLEVMQNIDPEIYQEPDLSITSNEIYENVEELVREFIRVRLEFPIRSAEFLRSTDSFRSTGQMNKAAEPA